MSGSVEAVGVECLMRFATRNSVWGDCWIT